MICMMTTLSLNRSSLMETLLLSRSLKTKSSFEYPSFNCGVAPPGGLALLSRLATQLSLPAIPEPKKPSTILSPDAIFAEKV